MKREHEIKINALEFEYTKQMALFTELNPEPVLRFDKLGEIIGENKSGARIIELSKLADRTFFTIFNLDQNELNYLITENQSQRLLKSIGDKTYSIFLVGNKDFKTLHVYFHDITDRVKMEQEILNSNEKIQQLSIRNEKIRDEEGKRIASEIHDGIGADLHGAGFLIQNINDLIEEKDIKEKIGEVTKLVDKVHNDMRGICYRLKPKVLEEGGLIYAIKALIDENNSKFDIKGKFSVASDVNFSSIELELSVFRVMQEAVNNILKHSKADNYFITFTLKPEYIQIIISDDGSGFDIEEYKKLHKPNLGLFNMEERIKNLGGEFKIVSEIDEGTTVYIKLKNNFVEEGTQNEY